jgi:uncharacterized protein (UPF0262 family)
LFAKSDEPRVQVMVGKFSPFRGLVIDFFRLAAQFGKDAPATTKNAIDSIDAGIQALQRSLGHAMSSAAIILRGGDHNW